MGAIELFQTRFHYRQGTVFSASTYLAGFLKQLAVHYRREGAILIQDNASYHKDRDVWSWFGANRHWLEVHQLPPYSPEFNPTERLWQYTRRTGTHNRYFSQPSELLATLTRVFHEMQCHPELIRRVWLLFVDHYVPFFMRSCIATSRPAQRCSSVHSTRRERVLPKLSLVLSDCARESGPVCEMLPVGCRTRCGPCH